MSEKTSKFSSPPLAVNVNDRTPSRRVIVLKMQHIETVELLANGDRDNRTIGQQVDDLLESRNRNPEIVTTKLSIDLYPPSNNPDMGML